MPGRKGRNRYEIKASHEIDRTVKDDFDRLDIRGGGHAPDNMPPAEYVVEATNYGSRKNKAGQITAVLLTYITVDSIWRDVELRQWLPLYPGKPINPGTKTWNHWALALGREPERREKFHPKVFLGKRFVAEVGYSSKEEHGRTFSWENTQRQKYPSDRLRIHSLKSRIP